MNCPQVLHSRSPRGLLDYAHKLLRLLLRFLLLGGLKLLQVLHGELIVILFHVACRLVDGIACDGLVVKFGKPKMLGPRPEDVRTTGGVVNAYRSGARNGRAGGLRVVLVLEAIMPVFRVVRWTIYQETALQECLTLR